jgi:methionine-gamma-lyase
MAKYNSKLGIGSLVNHAGESGHASHSHINPIYQTSTFSFPDVDFGAAIFKGEEPGYYYTRIKNPNLELLARKYALLEAYDLLQENPDKAPEEIAGGMVFASGMAAITGVFLARCKAGDTIIAQSSLYSATHTFLKTYAPRYGMHTVFLNEPSPDAWEAAFKDNPGTVLAYAESPSNPSMAIVDLKEAARIAHANGAWLVVDNTFASPVCQRPLTLGADIVVHSTTKYLSGHGLLVGGAVVSTQLEFIQKDLNAILKNFGANVSPFEAWLANAGLKTLEIRMERHCSNAQKVAEFLENHLSVSKVWYPGLPSHPDNELAKRQMLGFGGMMSFELKGGLEAGKRMMNRVQLATLAVSLGNTDTLIQHPASMTHSNLSAEVRREMGLNDGLVRLSVGIENVEDIIADLDQAMGEGDVD